VISAEQSKALTLEDVLIAARTAVGEASSAGYEAMRNVALVMVNRWKKTDGQFAKDDTLATACLRHMQFSSWNAGDPNLLRMTALNGSDRVFRRAIAATLDAIDGTDDPTKGSTHYHTIRAPRPDMVWPPVWAAGQTPVFSDAVHHFYIDIK